MKPVGAVAVLILAAGMLAGCGGDEPRRAACPAVSAVLIGPKPKPGGGSKGKKTGKGKKAGERGADPTPVVRQSPSPSCPR